MPLIVIDVIILFTKQEFKMPSNNGANKRKRQRLLLNDDANRTENANCTPHLNKRFGGEIPKHLLDDTVTDKKEMVAVSIDVYGSAKDPIFLARDVGKLCKLQGRSIRDCCQGFNGTLILFGVSLVVILHHAITDYLHYHKLTHTM